MKALDWYPKKFTPGDIDGDGAKKLLGTPSIPLASVLVRETAQNSWDARTGVTDVDFALNMRMLSEAETHLLRDVCLPETADEVDIVESLHSPIWVLEISDRGTVGLRGPTRNDLTVPDGIPTNFIDLVFNMGGKHEIAAAGGTYGFGKTVTYKASALGSILMWSRIQTEDGHEDRIIGSSIGDRFDMDGYRYTGRHWWGRSVDGYIQPLVGEEATNLGEAVFARHFGAAETGTSILVLMPVLADDSSPEADLASIAEAVRWHLWPKRLEAQDDDVRMNIDVQLNGQSVQLFPEHLVNPVIDAMNVCLRAVRATQSGDPAPEVFPPVQVQEVWCQRPLTLLGHVAFQRYQDRPVDTFAEEIVPIEKPFRHVALMRNSAELVVKYLPALPLDTAGFSWMGVFKPVADMDHVFASAEPPAHDDWVPDGVSDRWGRTQVRVGLRTIKQLADEFAQPVQVPDLPHTSKQSVAGIADALADLIPTVSATRPQPRPPGQGGSPGTRKPKVDVVGQILGPPDSKGNRLHALQIHVTGGDLPVLLVARSSIGVEGGSDDGGDDVRVAGWSNGKPELKASPPWGEDEGVFTSNTDTCWVIVRTRVDLALDVQIDVVI